MKERESHSHMRKSGQLCEINAQQTILLAALQRSIERMQLSWPRQVLRPFIWAPSITRPAEVAPIMTPPANLASSSPTDAQRVVACVCVCVCVCVRIYVCI